MQSGVTNMDWVVSIRSDFLTLVFTAFTELGYGDFLLIFIPLGYWVISKKIFARVGLWFLLSVFLNAYLKDFFQDPRPDLTLHLDPHVGQSFGFPSGHAQQAVVIWFAIAWQARKKWVWIICTFLVAGICFSRIYLGVHDVGDVFGGIGIGVISLLLFMLVTTGHFAWWHNLHFFYRIYALIAIEAFFLLTWPQQLPAGMFSTGVFLLGFWTGVEIECEYILFDKHRHGWRVSVCAALGVIGLVALRKGFLVMADNFESQQLALALSLAFISGLYMTALAPWLFQLLRLANKDRYGHGSLRI